LILGILTESVISSASSIRSASPTPAGKLYVADTYNHKIKVLDIRARESRTYAGNRERGLRDGERLKAIFNEPGGISRDQS
jgi:hypothetical protein